MGCLVIWLISTSVPAGFGAYSRLNDAVVWAGGLNSIQYQLKLPVHLGAKRALELQGYGTTLRPELVQQLLEACRSVKAKRLFLFLAEEAGHAWVKELNILKLDLGKGKRSIVKGGRFDKKYQITVEPNMDTGTGTDRL